MFSQYFPLYLEKIRKLYYARISLYKISVTYFALPAKTFMGNSSCNLFVFILHSFQSDCYYKQEKKVKYILSKEQFDLPWLVYWITVRKINSERYLWHDKQTVKYVLEKLCDIISEYSFYKNEYFHPWPFFFGLQIWYNE